MFQNNKKSFYYLLHLKNNDIKYYYDNIIKSFKQIIKINKKLKQPSIKDKK